MERTGAREPKSWRKERFGGLRVRNALQSGDVERLVKLHGALYAQEYGWDPTFEAYVADPLAAFASTPTQRERIWIVEQEGQIAGSGAIVDALADKAQLRWLLLHPDLRGQGIGRMLVEEAIHFCREQGYQEVFLWTVSTLMVAAELYRSVGFVLTEEKTHRLWGAMLTEQRYALKLT